MKACQNHFITKMDTGEFIAISLGFDPNGSYGEQVNGLRRTFHTERLTVPGKFTEVADSEMSLIPNIPTDALIFGSVTAFGREYSCLICSPAIASTHLDMSMKALQECGIDVHGDKDMYTSWGEGGFAMAITGELSRYVYIIYKALMNKDAMISISSPDDVMKGLTILKLGSPSNILGRNVRKGNMTN